MHNHQAIADKYSGKLCQLYTLEGIKEAIVTARLHPYATIRTLNGSTSIQVNWLLVERKMEGDKLFYAC